MLSPVRGVGGLPSAAMALALGLWGLSGGPALAQGVCVGGPDLGWGREHGCFTIIRPHLGEASIHNWGAYVLGKECMYPYVADPYSDPRAFGVWPPYSAPVAGVPVVAARGNDPGIDAKAVADAGGAPGLKVAGVPPVRRTTWSRVHRERLGNDAHAGAGNATRPTRR